MSPIHVKQIIVIAALGLNISLLACSERTVVVAAPETEVVSTQKIAENNPIPFGERVQKRRTLLLDTFTGEFDRLDPKDEWALQTTALVKRNVEAYRASRQNPFSVTQLECRGKALCKLVLSYPSMEKAREVAGDMRNNEVVKWPGHTKSFALHRGATDEVQKNQQLIFLTAKTHELSLSDGRIVPVV